MQLLGIVIIGIVGVLMLINASVMIVSPRAWFRLPPWLGAKGTMTPEKYGTGWGAIQVRLVGAIMLAVFAWVLFGTFIRQQ